MTVGGATEASLKDRRTLAEEGVITIVALVDADTGRLAEPPDFLARGFVHDETTFDAVVPLIEKALAKAAQEGIGEPHQLEQLIHRDGQPVGPGHLPAQPDHPADHHRRLRYARAGCRPSAGRYCHVMWFGQVRPLRVVHGPVGRGEEQPDRSWPAVCAIPQLTPAGCGSSRISAANRRTAASTAAVGGRHQEAELVAAGASAKAPGNEALAPSKA